VQILCRALRDFNLQPSACESATLTDDILCCVQVEKQTGVALPNYLNAIHVDLREYAHKLENRNKVAKQFNEKKVHPSFFLGFLRFRCKGRD
jgi:hypothetical protein